FDAARKLSPAERAAYLLEIGAQEPALREQVQSLLDALTGGEQFLAEPTLNRGEREEDTAVDLNLTERRGATIGPYILLERLGEGGFGTVYLAEQRDPVHRRVALKLIKPGMDTRQVIARFEAERQALAMMEHPNIARVLDAGATDAGRPYFVMELVKGVPI